MLKETDQIALYLPDIVAFFLPQVGFLVFLLLFSNIEVDSVKELNLMIYSFWIILAIPALISGLLTRNTTDGFEATLLSGILLFPILANLGLIIIQGFVLLNFFLILIFGVIIGFYCGCFGYMGGWIGKKAFAYSRPEKKNPFELLKGLITKILPIRMDKTGE